MREMKSHGGDEHACQANAVTGTLSGRTGLCRLLPWLALLFFATAIVGCRAAAKRYVKEHPDLSPKTREAILRHEVIIGMTFDEVRASLGKPDITNRVITEGQEPTDIWTYLRGSYPSYHGGVRAGSGQGYQGDISTTFPYYRYTEAIKITFIKNKVWRVEHIEAE